jgi:CHAD domain-containing protein
MALDKNRLHKSVSKLRKLLRKPPKQSTPEMIHDFRTHIRRLEATLGALDMESPPREQRVLKDLSRLRRRAGKVRDMDVLTGCASAVQVKDEEDCSVRLLEYLGAKRYGQGSKMQALIQKYGSRLRKRLKRTSERLEKRLSQVDKGHSEAIRARTIQYWSELRIPASLNKENLHA